MKKIGRDKGHRFTMLTRGGGLFRALLTSFDRDCERFFPLALFGARYFLYCASVTNNNAKILDNKTIKPSFNKRQSFHDGRE